MNRAYSCHSHEQKAVAIWFQGVADVEQLCPTLKETLMTKSLRWNAAGEFRKPSEFQCGMAGALK